MNVLTVAFALLCGLSNATSSVLQRRAVAGPDQVAGRGLSAAVARLLQPLRQPVWWAGAAAIVSAAVFQVLALNGGQLAVVQPLLASELMFTLVIGTVVFRHRPDSATWWAFAMLAVGLAFFLGAASPSAGVARPSDWRWLIAGVCVLGVVAGFLLIAHLFADGVRAAILGTATAVCFASTAAVMKEATQRFHSGLEALFTSWPLYAAAALGASGMLLLQWTLRTGTLTASQPALTLGDALVSTLLGITLFGERLALGWRLVPEAVGVCLIVGGVVGLTRTPEGSGERSWDSADSSRR